MQVRFYIFVLLLLFICVDVVQSQQFIYTYSATGNRKQCYVGFAKIAASPDVQEQYTETIDNIQFKIFPNPTKGLLKIDNDDISQPVPSRYLFTSSAIRSRSCPFSVYPNSIENVSKPHLINCGILLISLPDTIVPIFISCMLIPPSILFTIIN